MTPTTAELLASSLGAAGVAAVYGRPIAGVGVPVASDRVASLLAAADERVHGSPAVAHLGDQVLRFGRGEAVNVLGAASPAEVVEAVAAAVRARHDHPTAAVAVRLDLDLDGDASGVAVAPVVFPPWIPADESVVVAVKDTQALGVLVGPGVLRERCEGGLRTLAAVLSVGVLNTWGAKGVFYWQSRHHLATIGLQADDYVLGGLADTDLILTSGLDLRESPASRWDFAPSIDVPPAMLASLSEVLARPFVDIPMPAIRSRLVAATNRGYESTGPRLAPSALTRQRAQLVGPAGLVAADPGLAGFFVARTTPTEAAGTICVPADPDGAGMAAAACLAARLRTPTRRCAAIVDGAEPDSATADVLDAAAALGVPVAVECWDPDGPEATLVDDAAAAAAALVAPVGSVRRVGIDSSQLEAFFEAAGAITAWR
jgi:hypothetical protein